MRRGQAVITGEGLLGRIVGVGRHSARVLLVTDLNSRIPVVTETTRFPRDPRRNNSNRPELEQVVPGAQVSPGDRIVTSGHGGVFPARLAHRGGGVGERWRDHGQAVRRAVAGGIRPDGGLPARRRNRSGAFGDAAE